jgi:hypothetical protein
VAKHAANPRLEREGFVGLLVPELAGRQKVGTRERLAV